jgi:hypothetical protein
VALNDCERSHYLPMVSLWPWRRKVETDDCERSHISRIIALISARGLNYRDCERSQDITDIQARTSK